MPVPRRRIALPFAFTTALILSACSGATPRVTVLGVEQGPAASAPRRSLLVLVEVVNPTGRGLHLSRLEYQVRATSWFESAGQVQLSREVGAGESAVVEIPVPVGHSAAHEHAIPYTLEGRLFALQNKIERSWRVAVRGAIGRAGDRSGPIRVTAVVVE
jgi:hypothetical protein